MNYDTLGDELVQDTLGDSDIYVKVTDFEKNKVTDVTYFEKAKGFLSAVDSNQNISLYDHLADVLQLIIRSKVPDAVEKFEELSLQVKKLRQSGDSDLTEVHRMGKELNEYIKEKQIFYKFPSATPDVTQTIQTADEDEEDSDNDDEEAAPEVRSRESTVVMAPDLSEVLPDVHFVMGRFGQAGIGLGPEEVYDLIVALKDLASQFKLGKVRFWGKVFGVKNDYYVAEAPYQEGIVQENFGWQTRQAPVVTRSQVEEETKEDEDADKDEEEEKEEEESDEETTEEPEIAKIPPIPRPKEKPKKKVPPEANGTGVNEFLYFVCSKFGQSWRVLPFMDPSHVSEARYVKRFFTGNLESEIRGFAPYPGREAHYLRAQIARITAATFIAPVDYYKIEGEEDKDEEEEENGNIVQNSEFVPRSPKHLYSQGLSGWVHCRKAILDQGRCIPMKAGETGDEEEEKEEADDEDEDEEKEEEEEPEILEAIVEIKVPSLRSISEDRAVGRLKPWTMGLSSKLVEEKAILIMYSSLWPGAYTFYDGKCFDHVYLGYGYKYSAFHYAPPIRPTWQKEYPVGRDVTEHVDVEILPPPPEESTLEEGDSGDDAEEGDDEIEYEDDEEKEEEDK